MANEDWAPGDPRGEVTPEPRTQYANEPRTVRWAPGDPRAPTGETSTQAPSSAELASAEAPAIAAPAIATFLPKLSADQLQIAKMAAGVAFAWVAWKFLRDDAGTLDDD